MTGQNSSDPFSSRFPLTWNTKPPVAHIFVWPSRELISHPFPSHQKDSRPLFRFTKKKLLDLDQAQDDIEVRPWGYEELRKKAFSLSEADLASLLGPAPSRTDVINVTFKELEVVLLHIAGAQIPAIVDLRPVSPRKLAANGLSEGVRTLLSAGMVASDRVREFFERYHDPQLGDRVVQAFKQKYVELRESDLLPDSIFLELQVFAGGVAPASPPRQAAVLTVLAYLFEACDIFERPPEELQP